MWLGYVSLGVMPIENIWKYLLVEYLYRLVGFVSLKRGVWTDYKEAYSESQLVKQGFSD